MNRKLPKNNGWENIIMIENNSYAEEADILLYFHLIEFKNDLSDNVFKLHESGGWAIYPIHKRFIQRRYDNAVNKNNHNNSRE